MSSKHYAAFKKTIQCEVVSGECIQKSNYCLRYIKWLEEQLDQMEDKNVIPPE